MAILQEAGMKAYFHYCSKGFKSEVLFASNEEFVAGMNRIGACLSICSKADRPVSVLSFCLMDNHFHFILYGLESDCNLFADNYKKLTSMWVSRHRGQPLLETIDVGHWFIPPQRTGEKIAYVLRNPVSAGLRVTPQGYKWSSAHLMYSDWYPVDARPASEFGVRPLMSILNSRVEIPDDWLITGNMIWPGSYVDYGNAEQSFRSVGNYMFELNNGNNDKEADEELLAGSFSLPDAEVRMRALELGIEYYRKDRISLFTAEERLNLARLLHKELRCNVKQIARVLHVSAADLHLTI